MDFRGYALARLMLVLATTIAAGHLRAATADAQAPSWIASLDNLVEGLEQPDAPGCVVGVVEDGALRYTNAYGIAYLDHMIPITPETVFDVGSVSKQFTAAAVVLAARSGALSLDDDIRQWLPEFPDYGTPITIRHLLHHTSGLRDHLQLFAIADATIESDAEVMAMIARQRGVNFPPGTAHLYSNSGYFLLAQIVERATGLTLAEYADREIFTPLGMHDTHVHDDQGRIVRRRAWGYGPVDGGFRMGFPRRAGTVGGGGVYSTVPDLARWVAALLHDGVGGAGFTEAMLTSGTLASGDPVPYAAGLSLGQHRGFRTVFHGGSSVGFRAGVVNIPEVETSAIVLCNLSRMDALGGAFTVADIVLGDRFGPVTTTATGDARPDRNAPPATFLTLTASELAEYEGYYYSPELDHGYEFTATDGDLALLRLKGPMPFAPITQDVFGTRNGWARVTFTRDANGQVTGYVMDIGRVDGLLFEKEMR
jgi:CubicO group peptidase (beta-lactamase class C family)